MIIGACGWGYNKTKHFERGKWTKLKQYIKLNTPGKNNGVLRVWVNDQMKVNYAKVKFRITSNVTINRFVIHPFFGGSTDWKTPVDTYTMFKSFKFADYQF